MLRLNFRIFFSALLAALLCIATAQADDFYTAPAALAAQAPGTLLKAQRVGLPALYRARAWRILYATRDYAGRPILSSGLVIASEINVKPGSPQNIVAWAHPTVGTDPKCAPTLRQSALQSVLGVKDLIGAGKIIVATDYPGLGTRGPVGYLVGKGQAYAVLDSVRAASRLPGLKVARDYAIYGYSQGGHAALFAAREAPTYMPEFYLRGAAAIAPPTDLARLFAYNANSIEGKILMSYTLQSWAIKYGLSLREVLSDGALATAWAINKTCIDDIGGTLEAFKLQQLFSADMFVSNPLHHPEWRRTMAENSITTWPTRVPLLVMQGSADTVVRPEVTQSSLIVSCQHGANVKFVSLAHKSHSGSAKDAFPAATGWLVSRLAGQPNDNSCPALVMAASNDGSRR